MITRLLFRLTTLAVLLEIGMTLGAASVAAKTVVCICGGGSHYCNDAEGYYRRKFAGATPPHSVQVDPTLADCMAKVVAGDSLIIVSHGNDKRFRWGDTRYSGFSGGRAAHGTGASDPPAFPLPPNFTPGGLNITVILQICQSGRDPAGDPISIGASMQAGLAVGAPPVVAPQNNFNFYPGTYSLSGPGEVLDDAQRCLEDSAAAHGYVTGNPVAQWLADYPPANSPTHPNAQDVANQVLSVAGCPGAEGTVTISFAYSLDPFEKSSLTVMTGPVPDTDEACDPDVAGVDPTADSRSFSLLPNPAMHRATILLATSRRQPMELDVHDLAGRRVKTLLKAAVLDAGRPVIWDLRDENGKRVQQGVYFVRLKCDLQTESRMLIVTE